MNTEFTHRSDERGVLRQAVSPAALLDWLDVEDESYERPASFGPEDEWDVGIPVMDKEDAGEPLRSEEWHAGYAPGARL